MEFIWECMVISFKGILGTIFWGIAIIVSYCLGAFIGMGFTSINIRKKPEYKGQPIVVQGGKENEEGESS